MQRSCARPEVGHAQAMNPRGAQVTNAIAGVLAAEWVKCRLRGDWMLWHVYVDHPAAVASCSLDPSAFRQVGQGGAEGSRNLRGEDESDVLTAAFDAAHVRAVDTGLVRERLLRQAHRQTALADRAAERRQFGREGMARGGARHVETLPV